MLALSLVTGAAAIAFGQDTGKSDSTGKKKGKKKKGSGTDGSSKM